MAAKKYQNLALRYVRLSAEERKDYQVERATVDRKIMEMRLARARKEQAQAEYQANWYENAPLSWLIRKTAFAFDRAVTLRLTKRPKNIPVFDSSAVVHANGEFTAKQLRSLRASYRDSVRMELIGPSEKVEPVLAASWIVYRALRKAGKLVFGPLLRRGK